MPSGIIGKAVAHSICNLIKEGEGAYFTRMLLWLKWVQHVLLLPVKVLTNGTAAALTVFPVVPDFETYPGLGRDLRLYIW